MNEIVLKLAVRTALILESVSLDRPGVDQLQIIARYFETLGFKSEDFPQLNGNHTAGQVDGVCREINNTLNKHEKIYLLLLVQDCLLDRSGTPRFDGNLHHLFNSIGVNSSLIKTFKGFLEQNDPMAIYGREYLLLSSQHSIENDMLEGQWIEDNVPHARSIQSEVALDHFKGHLLVMFVDQIKSYVVRCIYDTDQQFDQDAGHPCRFRILKPGNELSIQGVPVLTFSGLKSRFLRINEKRELNLAIDHIQYTNKKRIKEIQPFSANETTGQLIGIVGREGVGKSTLLKLLAGKFKPDTGCICINGYDLWKYKYLLKGVIGFVPEEDLLFEELTVVDNLSLTARLYYSGLSRFEIEAKVNALLSKLDLLELKHVIVGGINSKHIQPGQRRLINIALELLREPQILLVDNALSGLGMSDASRVIKVLHDYSFTGNLVITSISQADSDTFMLFDKIWILDEGGCAVYNGPVQAAPDYLFKNLKLSSQVMDKIDPALLLDLVGYKLPDKEGQVWKRVLEPEEWHNQFLRDSALHENQHTTRSILPARILKIPNLEVQLLIFSIRNFKCKFSRINNIIKTLLIGPFIALLVSGLFRISGQNEYTLLSNPNIPLYQFISVVVAVFLGLIASVDEIIQERNILEKEEYQEFSRFSYLNSKILYLFPVIAIEVMLYVFTGNLILGIREMFWVYWAVMFSSASFGILLGLVFSSSIYNSSFLHKGILPFVIAVQVLLGGGVIAYDRLNLGKNKYSPVIGDLMVSRWGYEALAVEYFKNNAFEKLVYTTDKKLDQAAFYAFQVVPKLDESLSLCLNAEDKDSMNLYIDLLRKELTKVAAIPDVGRFEYINKLSELGDNDQLVEETRGYISSYLSMHFYDQYQMMIQQKSLLMGRLVDSIGAEKVALLRQNFHNLALEETVTNSNSEKEYSIIGNEIIRTKGMIFQDPGSNWGRACFFSPVKQFRDEKTETLFFNISMIWMLTSLCYIYVLFDLTGLIRNVLRIGK